MYNYYYYLYIFVMLKVGEAISSSLCLKLMAGKL